jgi:hypothetical protein
LKDGFCNSRAERRSKSSELTGGPLLASLLASDTSIKASLEPVKLIEGIGKGGCDIDSRFAVQPLGLD